MILKIQRRKNTLRGLEAFMVRFYVVLLGLILLGFIFWLNGVNPFTLYFELLRVSFFREFGLEQTLLNFIPLLLLGIGIAIPAKAQIDNIGAEGQFVIGAMAGFWTAMTFPELNSIILIPLMMFVSFLAGAIWALPIAIFRVKGGFRGADVVVSFLLVFPAQFLLVYMITNPWKSAAGLGFPGSDPIAKNARIPLFEDIGINAFSGVHITIFLAIIIAFIVNYFIFKSNRGIPKTKLGYEINVIGKNQEAGNVAGMNFMKIALITVIISGGLAGIAGATQLAGNRNNIVLRRSISSGLGFTAIAVAWLGGLSPIGIIFSAILFAGLATGSLSLQGVLGLPATTVDLIIGAILLFVLISEFFFRFTITSQSSSRIRVKDKPRGKKNDH